MNAAKSLSTQVRTFFGLLPGQTDRDIVRELATLDENARMELASALRKVGLPVRRDSIQTGLRKAS